MSDVARVRISRVRFKDGRDLRIISAPERTEIIDRIRSWADNMCANPPQAFLAVGFRWDDPDEPNPETSASWWTDATHLPTRLLVPLALETLRANIDGIATERVIMRNLGYAPEDDAS